MITGRPPDRGIRQAMHLGKRFFGALPRHPPPADDDRWAASLLLPGEQALWSAMVNHDRRHAVMVAQRFQQRRPRASRPEMAGALLHDVGKIESDLSVFGRVAARLVGPRTRRLRVYLDHEAIGARLAADAGSDPCTVAMVAGAAGSADVEPAALAALHDADNI